MSLLSLAWFEPIFWGIGLGVLAMLLHECGHILAAVALGLRVKALRAGWKGMYIVREPGTPAQNFKIAIAGPLTNIILLAAWPLSEQLFLANLCFGLINLLPIQGADGERALLYWKQMQESSDRTLAAPSRRVTHEPNWAKRN